MNKQTFVRMAEFSIRDDGRTLDGRVVPYGEVAHIVEMDETGELVRYDEQFLPHSLAAMAQGFKSRSFRGLHVPLVLDHNESFDSLIGHAVELESRDDGAYATFRLYDDSNITKIRSVLNESHTGLSVKFKDTREPKLIDGIVSRVQVFVAHVAATPAPAYAGAGISSIRSTDEPPVAITPTLDELKQWLQMERERQAQ